MHEIQNSILQKVEKEVTKKLAEKKSCRKKLKTTLVQVSRAIFYKLFNNPEIKIKKYQHDSKFGCDIFGRDVEDGLQKYVELLKSRKLQIRTIIILGSRAKGSWKPNSDIDVTIIAANLPKGGTNLLTRRLFGWKRNLVLSDRPLYLGIEPSGCCSQKEFIERLKKFDVQALDAVFYGQVIYDNGFWPQVLESYEELEKAYKLPRDKLLRLLKFL
jgi:predicted nucleotidyltransferase